MGSRRDALTALTALMSGTLPALATATASGTAPLPRVGSGRLERLSAFPSKHIPARHVEVWLPPGYTPARRHAVVYMHDGQMLFDPDSTWNHQAWRIDAAVSGAIAAGRMPPTLVVGVWNQPDGRYAEYFPQKALAGVPEALRREYIERGMGGAPRADAYLRFLVEELKPEIDRRYATRPEAAATAVAGSSMGGLISLYALCEYPEVFGAAAALSTHWIGLPTSWGLERARNASLPLAVLDYLAQRLPAAGKHRLWIDRGNDALDSLYAPALAMAAELLRDRGYRDGDAHTSVVEGTGHNEHDWSQRIGEALSFVLPAAP